jgi:repressor LexA
MIELTPRQSKILKFIRDSIAKHGFSPTIREIAAQFKIRSPNGVESHLRALERKGLIDRQSQKSRTIVLTSDVPEDAFGLPLVGRVRAGVLHEAVEEPAQAISLDSLFQRTGTYLLKVEGESMIDAHIADGDWVVVEPRRRARPGDIAVVQTEEGEATLKYFFPERNRIRLQPANKRMKPIYLRNARVLGVVSGVIRKF